LKKTKASIKELLGFDALSMFKTRAFATYGLGMFIGTWFAGRTIDMLTVDGVADWRTIWYVPTAIAAVVLVIFIFLFKEKKKTNGA